MPNENKRPAPTTDEPDDVDTPIPPRPKRPRAKLLLPIEPQYTLQERVPVSTLQDLKGMDEVHKKLRRSVILPFSNPKKAALLHLDVPRGILLTGVPGTGKTALADAIVNELKAAGKEVHYYQETGACLTSEFGGSEKNMRELFQTAKENAPSVIFLDELDGLGKCRDEGLHSARHTILTTMLTEISNLTAGDVLLIAATNCVELCDPALIRKGRFDLIINLPRPSSLARGEIITHYFNRKGFTLHSWALDEIAQRTERCTGSDLKYLVERIYGNIIERSFPDGKWADLEEEEILEKLESQFIDMDNDVRPELKQIEEENGVQGMDRDKCMGLYT